MEQPHVLWPKIGQRESLRDEVVRKLFGRNLKQYYLEQVGKIRLKISVVQAEITTRNAFISAKSTCITTSFEQLEVFGRLKTQIGSLTSEFETLTVEEGMPVDQSPSILIFLANAHHKNMELGLCKSLKKSNHMSQRNLSS